MPSSTFIILLFLISFIGAFGLARQTMRSRVPNEVVYADIFVFVAGIVLSLIVNPPALPFFAVFFAMGYISGMNYEF